MDLKWLIVPKGQLTFDAEGHDIEGSPFFLVDCMFRITMEK